MVIAQNLFRASFLQGIAQMSSEVTGGVLISEGAALVDVAAGKSAGKQ